MKTTYKFNIKLPNHIEKYSSVFSYLHLYVNKEKLLYKCDASNHRWHIRCDGMEFSIWFAIIKSQLIDEIFFSTQNKKKYWKYDIFCGRSLFMVSSPIHTRKLCVYLWVGVWIAQADYRGPMTWTVKVLDHPSYIQARLRPMLFLLDCFA